VSLLETKNIEWLEDDNKETSYTTIVAVQVREDGVLDEGTVKMGKEESDSRNISHLESTESRHW
jgi:hypothetical protein